MYLKLSISTLDRVEEEGEGHELTVVGVSRSGATFFFLLPLTLCGELECMEENLRSCCTPK